LFLKRLELYGFKTFSQKTEIEFTRGFLAVVGPNGSGKSNLTDAIRFCLGEHSVKAMRATKLDELVFAGTPTRKGSPYAEVTAIFDNSDQVLPLDLPEVAITRRLEADGDSKFFINRTACRLRDIHELLMGSGVGPGSFSVLGGKEVDQVLSTDPKERRNMLEETAGVNRYKFRKREAQRRLEKTAGNLTRLHDILRELELQLEESEKQLERYRKYREAQVELKALELELAIQEWSRLQQQIEELRA
jgi:chromosome segregation protein